jgi:RND family efflux transporter MFP subunit
MNVYRPSLIALAAAAALAVAPWTATAAGPVPTVAVATGAAAAGFELDGALEPLRQSTVAAQVAGNVTQLLVKAGDRVTAGQVLARIDDRDTAAGVAQADAGVAQAEAAFRNAKVNVERTRELRAQQFVSQAALDVAETQFKAAEAALRQAQAARSQAALARGFTAVTAPFAGVVLATHLEAGDLATPGRPVATVYVPGALRAVVQVPASRLPLARAAQRVEVLLPGATQWIAPTKVTPLPSADAVSQTVEWRLDLPADAAVGQLPGATVRVRFAAPSAPAAADAVPTVPARALLKRGELTAVYVVEGDRFVLRAVRTGAPVGEQVQVLAGLKAGDRVATDPVRAGLAGATPAP